MEFNCRDCPEATRERCIQACSASPSVKLMMRRAFEAGTDTQQMWGMLEMNCLLLRREEQAAMSPRQTALMRRLKGEPAGVEAAEVGEQVATSPSQAEADGIPFQPAPVVVRERARPSAPVQVGAVEGKRAETPSFRYGLALQGGQHRIALPGQGEIVLGRFDPMIDVTPDVDLSHDDREHHLISRRHARIVSAGGRHEVEDLGSTNGTRVNDKMLVVGQRVQLRLGDRVALGYCEFVYVPIPDLPVSPRALSKAYFWVAFTGRSFAVPPHGEVVVGRSDQTVGLIPDIDLGQEGDVAQVVARRHVKIIARNGRHYVEDLGSASGTRLNGVRLELGELGLLSPGDHLWLGGCVLAYDVEHEQRTGK